MMILFSKMEGLGNDFIIIDDTKEVIKIPYGLLAKRLCDRHFGIGGDGLIVVKRSKTCDIKFLIFNMDGSEAEMCGNGMRCFAKYLYDNRIISKRRFTVSTRGGVIIPEILLDEESRVENIKVDMGEPVLDPSKIVFITDKKIAVSEKITASIGDIILTAVSMGNPHAVIFCDKHDDDMIEKVGPAVEKHALFPNGTNVEFVEVVSRNELNVRVWERGVGETLACGTGACAALVASYLNGKTETEATLHLPGGDLYIEWNLEDKRIYKTGPASLVFEGSYAV